MPPRRSAWLTREHESERPNDAERTPIVWRDSRLDCAKRTDFLRLDFPRITSRAIVDLVLSIETFVGFPHELTHGRLNTFRLPPRAAALCRAERIRVPHGHDRSLPLANDAASVFAAWGILSVCDSGFCCNRHIYSRPRVTCHAAYGEESRAGCARKDSPLLTIVYKMQR